jgi:hypothetical protein
MTGLGLFIQQIPSVSLDVDEICIDFTNTGKEVTDCRVRLDRAVHTPTYFHSICSNNLCTKILRHGDSTSRLISADLFPSQQLIGREKHHARFSYAGVRSDVHIVRMIPFRPAKTGKISKRF